MNKAYAPSHGRIGGTPLVELVNLKRELGLRARIFAKLESHNPAGSIKDRVALSMIEDAEAQGLIKPGSVIIEPTSGNTGIGLAMVCTQKGYRSVIVMPDSMSKERIELMKSYGAEVILTDGRLGMKGAIEKAEELRAKTENSYIPDQFSNPANPKVHRTTTGPEIYEGTRGKVDVFVCGVGTGGTVSGVGEYLKSVKSEISIVAVEPKESAVLSGGAAGAHGIQGIGAGFIPKTLNRNIIDRICTVSYEDALASAKLIRSVEGIGVGISSGAAFAAARDLAGMEENEGKTIVVVFPDGADRYASIL